MAVRQVRTLTAALLFCSVLATTALALVNSGSVRSPSAAQSPSQRVRTPAAVTVGWRTRYDFKQAATREQGLQRGECGAIVEGLRRLVRLQQGKIARLQRIVAGSVSGSSLRQRSVVGRPGRVMQNLAFGSARSDEDGGQSAPSRGENILSPRVTNATLHSGVLDLAEVHLPFDRSAFQSARAALFMASPNGSGTPSSFPSHQGGENIRPSKELMEAARDLHEVLTEPAPSDPCSAARWLKCNGNKTQIVSVYLKGDVCKTGATVPKGLFSGAVWDRTNALVMRDCESAPELLAVVSRLRSLKRLDVRNNWNKPRDTALPDDIANLTHLTHVVIEGTGLAELPFGFSRLKQMRTLRLTKNKLRKVPSDIGLMRNLEKLTLFDNAITELPDSIGDLDRLEFLNLGRNLLHELPQSVGRMVAVTNLVLSDNKLARLPDLLPPKLNRLAAERNKLKSLPESMGALKDLSYLDLDFNMLTTLPAGIVNMSNLKVLKLNENSLHSIPDGIGRLSRLQILDLTENKLKALPESFGDLDKLQKISLRNNQLATLPPSLHKMVSVLDIDLEDNMLRYLPDHLPPNTIHLRAASNSLVALPDSIQTLKSLATLDLAKNELRGLPNGMGNMSSLATVDLHTNQLESLPADLGGATMLTELNLRNNRLRWLPDLAGLKLNGLNVDFNRLESLPANLGRWQVRATLRLDHNRLETLPASIGSLPYVNMILAKHNRIKSIPDSLWSAPLLQTLHIDYNNITELGAAMNNATSLKVLSAEHNHISTLPPGGFSGMKSIESIHLRHNKISSFPSGDMLLPKGTRPLPVAIVDFSHNLIGPSVPESLVKYSTIGTLDLSHNLIQNVPELYWDALRFRVIHGDGQGDIFATVVQLVLDHNRMKNVVDESKAVAKFSRGVSTNRSIQLDRSVFASDVAANAAAAALTAQDANDISWARGAGGASTVVGEECSYVHATAAVKIASVVLRECRCADGYYRSSGVERCLVCPRHATCLAETMVCDEAFFGRWADDGAALCDKCPEGAECLDNKIVPKPGHWWDRRYALSGEFVPKNTTLLGNTTLVGSDGIWSVSALPLYQQQASSFQTSAGVFSCQHKDACEGGVASSCQEGYEGRLCSTCTSNYYSTGHGVCEKCPPLVTTAILASFGVITITTIVVVAFWQSSQRLEKVVGRGNTFLGSRASLLSGDSLTAAKILVSFLQILVTLDITYDLEWPKQLQFFDQLFGWVNMDVLTSTSLECLWEGLFGNTDFDDARSVSEGIAFSYYTTLCLSAAAPLLASLLLFAVWLGLGLVLRLMGRENDVNREIRLMLHNGQLRCMQSHLLVWMFAYMPVSAKSLGYFRCDTFNGGDTYWLHSDLSIQCYDGRYYDFMPIAVASIVVYTLGFPISVLMNHFAWIRCVPSNAVAHGDGSVLRQAVVTPIVEGFKALSRPYKEEYGYWEAVEMGRKVLVGAAAIHFGSTPTFQLTVALAISFMAAVLHFHCAPFKTSSTNNLAGANLCLLYFTMTIGILRRLDVDPHKRAMFIWFVMGADGVFSLLLLALITKKMAEDFVRTVLSSFRLLRRKMSQRRLKK